jgi:hypothetical protein
MSEALANLLYDHYKDTFSHIRERERQRDRLFLIVLGLVALVLFQLHHSLLLQQAVTELTIAGFKLNLSKIPFSVLLSASWMFLAVFLVRYYQVVIHIEKQYDYLHPLESRLSRALGEDESICRESSGYTTKKASFFRHWVWVFYTGLFPFIILASVGWAMLLEWKVTLIPIAHKCFDSALAVMVLFSLVLYGVGCWLNR